MLLRPTLASLRGWQRGISLVAILTLLVYSLLLYREPEWIPGTGRSGTKGTSSGSGDKTTTTPPSSHDATRDHPIDDLIRDARFNLQLLLGKRSHSVGQAASRYRERRGRHPPPGFDAWFEYAQKHDAVIVEEFFDRIHHDINPFWALEPQTMRTQTHTQIQLIRVRNGKSHFETDNPKRPPWIQEWARLIAMIEQYLPDLDMVVNIMDETRLFVPFEKMASYVKTEQDSRHFTPIQDALDKYSGLADVEAKKEKYDHSWIRGEEHKYWDHLRVSCPPGSPGANVSTLPYPFPASVEYPSKPMPYMYKGFVQNFTASQDPCEQPHMRSMHATFIESMSMSTSHDLLPMFAGCKMLPNNEILIPGAMYITEYDFYSGGDSHGNAWADKKDGLVWRGAGSGGRNREEHWWHFQRFRWVQMMNGTTVTAVENGDKARGPSFDIPPVEPYRLPQQQQHKLGEWLETFSDVGFVDLECFPATKKPDGTKYYGCNYTDPFMKVADKIPMKEMYTYKFLPDVDGNSYSARYRGFLRSTSMALKSTIYAEWHDDRLMPWVHFAPFDSSYMDIYAIMDYFMKGHDFEASRIAEEGRLWAESVLRMEDMQLYVWRLLLEYARVVDDNRDRLAYVADLK